MSARYESKDVSFDVPRDWDEKTIVAFSAPLQPNSQVTSNVVLTRDALGTSDTLAIYSDKQLVELAKRLPGFDLSSRKDLTVSGQPAVELRFSWSGAHGVIVEQRVMMIAQKKRLFNLTATAPRGEMAKLEPIYDRIFNSLKLGDAHKSS